MASAIAARRTVGTWMDDRLANIIDFSRLVISEREVIFSKTTLLSALEYYVIFVNRNRKRNFGPSVPARVFRSFPGPSANAVKWAAAAVESSVSLPKCG